MKDLFSEIYLDRILKEEFCALAIREEWITEYESTGMKIWQEDLIKRRINHKQKILLYAVLFEQMNGSETHYDLSNFLSEGIISEQSNFLNHKSIHFGGDDYQNLGQSDKDLIARLRQTAITIITEQNKSLAKKYRQEFFNRRSVIMTTEVEWD